MDSAGLFIAGTDTGVGKTLVTTGLTRLARSAGVHAVALKPVETGCRSTETGLYPEDGACLVQASDHEISLDDCVPLRFALPASPYRAATAEGKTVSVDRLIGHVRDMAERVDLALVEGAGGLMVPLTNHVLSIDLVARLGYPVILVARSALGTINHTLLSLEALQRRDIVVRGIILSSCSTSPGPEEMATPEDIQGFVLPIPVLTLPWMDRGILGSPSFVGRRMEDQWGRSTVFRLLGPVR
jgi:dethiobiotin synthetase